MKKFGWCFIGCGRLAGRVARQITSSGRHEIVSVWSRNSGACAAFGAQYGASVCASGERLIAEGDGSYVREFDTVAEEIRQGLRESRFVPHRATLDVMRLMDECRAQMGLVYPFER